MAAERRAGFFVSSHVVAISAPENIARIDEIRANVARLTDPRKTTADEAVTIAQNNPAIAWMAYTIHGNESSSFEAMMQVVYQLAASNEPATLDILKITPDCEALSGLTADAIVFISLFLDYLASVLAFWLRTNLVYLLQLKYPRLQSRTIP